MMRPGTTFTNDVRYGTPTRRRQGERWAQSARVSWGRGGNPLPLMQQSWCSCRWLQTPAIEEAPPTRKPSMSLRSESNAVNKI
jgi:hypothetical protein